MPPREDPVRDFLSNADKIMREARLVVEALPNTELFAAERSLRQLRGIHVVLANMDDPWLSQSEIDGLIDAVIHTGASLENYLDSPHPPHNIGTHTENNGVERRMIARWGEAHRSYLRGRSTQNIRMERNWRDVRKDTLEFFREIFMYLVDINLLDMENPIHRVCLFVVFQPRIQKSLDETIASWNLHKLRTAGNKSPHAIFQLSREKAINRGYWTGDPGDPLSTASDPHYGQDPDAPLPPAEELQTDPTAADYTEYPDVAAEREAGVVINDDDEVSECREILSGMDFLSDDGNWGIDLYCTAVMRITEHFMG
ncbi:hypothetical protein R3P38DRAFT_2772390 [Favolaschia claudopus]|uniref:Integrase core domain-containing protein n=1 Tax=Favolaschia claudopus TaxID=2862362 RepID=A0AAW0C6R2_9AGAR